MPRPGRITMTDGTEPMRAIGSSALAASKLRLGRSTALMTCEPIEPTSSVLPSGAERAAASEPMIPPAAAIVDDDLGAEPRRDSCATILASMSAGPPAANGTMILIVSAFAGAAKQRPRGFERARGAVRDALDPISDSRGKFLRSGSARVGRQHQGRQGAHDLRIGALAAALPAPPGRLAPVDERVDGRGKLRHAGILRRDDPHHRRHPRRIVRRRIAMAAAQGRTTRRVGIGRR